MLSKKNRKINFVKLDSSARIGQLGRGLGYVYL